MTSLNELEAQRRVNRACDLIAAAYRLYSLAPKDTISQVQSAIAAGAEAQAEDIREETFR